MEREQRMIEATPASQSSLHLISPNGWLAYGVALGAVMIDQASKFWILYGLDLPARFKIPILPPIFNLTMVWNRGVSFGLLKADNGVGRSLLSLFAAIVVIAIGWWVRKAERRLTAVALGLVMGGALGNNLIDRIRLGSVADFLDFSDTHLFPWVFNVADSCITIGVVLLLIETLLTKPAAPQPAA